MNPIFKYNSDASINPNVQGMSVIAMILHYYNPGHNILRLFDVLPNFAFTTSELKRDHY